MQWTASTGRELSRQRDCGRDRERAGTGAMTPQPHLLINSLPSVCYLSQHILHNQQYSLDLTELVSKVLLPFLPPSLS